MLLADARRVGDKPKRLESSKDTMPSAPPLLRFVPAVLVVLWSTRFIAAKFAVPVFGPFSLLALRFLIVVPVLSLAWSRSSSPARPWSS
jgi:drug/metabolite transporter (DMT)-like permease